MLLSEAGDRIFSLGAAYDARRPGFHRSLQVALEDGYVTASWRNGPLDPHRCEVSDTTIVGAVDGLVRWLEEQNRLDDEEASAAQ